jgi:hypothetical protein
MFGWWDFFMIANKLLYEVGGRINPVVAADGRRNGVVV